MNLESPFYRSSCLNPTLSMNRNYTLGWWRSWIPWRFTLNLAVDLYQDSLIWKNRRYPFKLDSSVCSRWVHISSDRQAGDFHSACETWKQAGASHFACFFSWLPKACVCFSALLPKQSHALTQAISGLLVTPRGEGYYLRNATILPRRPLLWHYGFHTFKAFQGVIASNVSLWVIWCFLTPGCDSVSQHTRTIQAQELTLTSAFDSPSIALQVCPENTEQSRYREEMFMNSSLWQQESRTLLVFLM